MKSGFEQEEEWRKNPENWKLKVFYFNKNDKRVFVSKRNPNFGVTLNFANPKSYLALVLISSFFGFIIYKILEKNPV